MDRSRRLRRAARLLGAAALVVLAAPVVGAAGCAVVSATSMFDEGTGCGAALWLLLPAVPTAGVLGVAAVVAALLGRRR